MPKKSYDFGGYATRIDLRCSDGRTIRRDAFKMNDGQTVPLVWQHQRNDPDNILGNARLENRSDGVYAYCSFNDSDKAQRAKMLVEHGDIRSLSIYANQLQQNGADVMHGNIREVSLVVAGANPGAFIDNLQVQHEDGSIIDLDGEAIIYSGEDLETEILHADEPVSDQEAKPEKEGVDVKEDKDDVVISDPKKIFDSLNDDQKNLLYAMVAAALAEGEDSSTEDDEAEQSDGGDDDMKHNVFEGSDTSSTETYTLTHEDQEEILKSAKKMGSLRDAMGAFAEENAEKLEHGVTDLEILFPEAKATSPEPEIVSRPMDWVSVVWNGFKKSPMSRIKSVYADITMDEARAKGYVKGHRKVEEEFALLKRVTQPTTIYKKQKFDRDDLIDITDFNFVAFIQREMRMMLNEELARAALIGDGRSPVDEDKIDENCIRPIYNEDPMYAIRQDVALNGGMTTTEKANAITEAAVRSRKEYRGSGNPTFFTTTDILNDLMLAKDVNGRRIYSTEAELCSAMRVTSIVEVPVMENMVRVDEGQKVHELLGIIVNLQDYTIGADRGGAVTMFDDFDIDYNKQIYLIETRLSGSLNKPYSAIILESVVETKPGKITITAPKPTDDVLGKKVHELQRDIQIGSDFIAGKLNFVTGYTGFSNTDSKQTGHYLVVKPSYEGDPDKIFLDMIGEGSNPALGEKETTSSDDTFCVLVNKPETEKMRIRAEKDGKTIAIKTYSLRNIQFV